MTHVPVDPTQRVFRLGPAIAIQGFEEGALLLRLGDRHVFELNPVAQFILAQTDGLRSTGQIAAIVAQAFGIPEQEAVRDILDLYSELIGRELIELAEPDQHHKEYQPVEGSSDKAVRYIRNPDVVLREEGTDGGLFFNPDTSQVKVVNFSGLFIWQQCDGTHDLVELVTALQEAFDEIPADRVVQDVEDFVADMVEAGFIGTMEMPGAQV
jgi:Coenzyme PQQ synthesis protein D (PqqD)